jgi:hypothetical protein
MGKPEKDVTSPPGGDQRTLGQVLKKEASNIAHFMAPMVALHVLAM